MRGIAVGALILLGTTVLTYVVLLGFGIEPTAGEDTSTTCTQTWSCHGAGYIP